MSISHDRVKEVLGYDPSTGEFTWKIQLSAKAKCGRPAGAPTGPGYLRIQIDGKRYLSHRLAWFYVYGEWPENEIDHINHNPSDNRMCNLRLATKAQNAFNRKSKAGVCWSELKQLWRAYLMVEGVNHHLGWFQSEEAARKARLQAEKQYHPAFCRYAEAV